MFFTFTTPLTEKYSEEIYQCIQKNLSIENPDLEATPFKRGELNIIFENGKLKGYALVAEVAACNLGGCTSFEKVNSNASSEYFDLLVITDQVKHIVSIQILDYFSDFGYEVTSKKYLKKFIGKDICAFRNEVDGIDAISGATISSYALEGMISEMCQFLDTN